MVADLVSKDASERDSLEGGSKNRPFRSALGPAVRVIVISTFPDIVQIRYSPLTKFDKLWLFSVVFVLASLSVTVSSPAFGIVVEEIELQVIRMAGGHVHVDREARGRIPSRCDPAAARRTEPGELL